jgi:cytochrome P450
MTVFKPGYPPGQQLSTPQLLWFALTQKFDGLEYASITSETYGPAAYSEMGPMKVFQFSDPNLIHEVLVEKAAQFHKGSIMKRAFTPFLGQGLLTSDGEFWKRQRKLAQPAFHPRRVETYGEVMVQHTDRMLDSWRSGQTVWLDREMMKVTLGIVCKTLFDADVSSEADRIGDLVNEVLEFANETIADPFPLPEWMPTPRRRKLQRAMTELDAIIQRIIDARRQSGDDRGDLLSMLLAARDENDQGMSDKQLRDEVMTLFLAGHETTAMTMAWAWYLLVTHPVAYARLQTEVDTVLAGRAPALTDLPRMPYAEQVIKEALRLYPAAPGANRQPIEETTIGGYPVKPGVELSLSIWAMHRSERYFPEPESFDPERFSPEREKDIPKGAYLPFGGGPRVCIGNAFASMEARLMLIRMAQRARLELVPGQTIKPVQLLTVRPVNGIQMQVTLREAAPAVKAPPMTQGVLEPA